MPYCNKEWVDCLTAAATELTTARGGTFTTQKTIKMNDYDELILWVPALSLPTATKATLYVLFLDEADTPVGGYATDLGGTDRGLDVPKADFVAGVGKVLPAIPCKTNNVKIDAVIDATDAAATMTVKAMRRRSKS